MQIAHAPLLDPDVQASLLMKHQQQTASSVDLNRWQIETYLETFDRWIHDSTYNHLEGLSAFHTRAYSAGALESLLSFVHRHCRARRLRFSRAEFVGSRIACVHAAADWLYLEDANIADNDAVILSMPFAGHGGCYPSQDYVLDECTRKQVPVLLDVAYFGISYDVCFNIDIPCVTDVVFSLSKCISAPLRLGLRYARRDYDDLVQVNSNQKIINRWAADLGIQLMNDFSHDWFVDRYKPVQQAVCKELGLTASKTLTLATSEDPAFDRQGYNRVCITNELHSRLF